VSNNAQSLNTTPIAGAEQRKDFVLAQELDVSLFRGHAGLRLGTYANQNSVLL
jgi:hypothetical protein